jgi:ketosteroid isomerase-like protein
MSDRRFSTPEEAEAAFYAAFEKADLAAMMEVWATDENIVCIHPLGPTLVGRNAVERSWKAIFQDTSPMRFRIEAQHRTAGSNVVVHVVHEHIEAAEQSHIVLATNVYHLIDAGWCMVLHHASPPPAADRSTATLH